MAISLYLLIVLKRLASVERRKQITGILIKENNVQERDMRTVLKKGDGSSLPSEPSPGPGHELRVLEFQN